MARKPASNVVTLPSGATCRVETEPADAPALTLRLHVEGGPYEPTTVAFTDAMPLAWIDDALREGGLLVDGPDGEAIWDAIVRLG